MKETNGRCISSTFRLLSLLFILLFSAQTVCAQSADSTAFKGYLLNKEYNVYLRINFYDRNIIVSGQEVFGELPGYIAKEGSSYCWMVTDVTIDGNKAEMEMVNDYGSEDLTATLTQENDSTYTLKHRSGATIKLPNNGKWQKLPSTMTFKKVRR